mmetsp:Transcript_42695/g.48524  ORF Transcript_42695/g.48524 Transcript_42695/m.48524 type:complete len:781 (-) Transcript_42695:173-2515(-)
MSTSGDGSSILSKKVLRALEVRTETPAMKAALEALGHLESMDSRSVRVAIEQNALEQALLLQEELEKLVNLVSGLRQGVSDTARIAHRVSEAIHSTVVSSQATALQKPTGINELLPPDGSSNMPESLPLSGNDALEKEQQLAALIADAFTERQVATHRAETVSAFLDKFNLSEEDSHLLDHYNFEDVILEDGLGDVPAEGMGVRFLDALERVKKIRDELSTAFGSTSVSEMLGAGNDQRLGAASAIRMMESLAMQQERAYERLYHWLQKYLHLNSVTHVPTSSSNTVAANAVSSDLDADTLDQALSHFFVRRSLKVLCNVPAFYSHTLELIANSRRSEETRRFLLALTAGFNGRPPIELKAHDPVNYVGDMLAFCFQSCSVEADVALGLIFDSIGTEGESTIEEGITMAEDDTNIDVSMSAADMLSHAMSGLARPLKSRILQVVASLARRPDEEDEEDGGTMDDDNEELIAQTRASALYAICGLMLFYRSALEKSIGKLEKGNDMTSISMDASLTSLSRRPTENPLVVAIDNCLAEAYQAYVGSIKVYGAMLESLSLIGGSSEAVLAQGMIEKITNVRVTSPGFATDVPCPNEEWNKGLSMEFIAATLLEAALVLCKTLNDSVTLKMSLTNAKKGGLSTKIASQLDAQISQTEQVLIADLVKTETKEVLEMCGLGHAITALRNMPPVEGIMMANQPGLTPDDLDLAMKEFYVTLYSPLLPAFENTIRDPVLKKLARQTIANSIIDHYEELYLAIKSDQGGYDDVSFLEHTPDQVKTLYSM